VNNDLTIDRNSLFWDALERNLLMDADKRRIRRGEVPTRGVPGLV